MTWTDWLLIAIPTLGVVLYILAPQIWRWATGRDPFGYYDNEGRRRW